MLFLSHFDTTTLVRILKGFLVADHRLEAFAILILDL